MKRSSDLPPIALALALALAGCEPSAAPAQYPQGQLPPGQLSPGQLSPQGEYPPGQLPPQGAYGPGQLPPQNGYGPLPPQNGYGPGQLPQGGYAPAPLPPPGPPVASDPINDVDMGWLRAAARGVLQELVAALPPASQAKVQGIPFVTDPTVGEVNAYAACNEQHMPLMAITDGLLQIEAYIAQLRATDEVFGTQKLDAYLQYLAKNQKPRQPIVAPPPGLVDPAQHVDYRKVVRQHNLIEEQMAFVLGHELGHHHLGHTGCANGQSGDRKVTDAVLFRMLQRVVPIANMPNEIAADDAGVNNLLSAGARRPGYHWTEQGALLTLDFFARLDPLTLESLAFSFASSHPNPTLRIPLVKQTAARWRQSGGAAWQPPPR